MKKIFALLAFVIASSELFGGWTNQGMIDKYAKCPDECMVLDKPVTFYGTRSGALWICCSVESTDGGLSYHIVGNPETTTKNNFRDALIFGQFDDNDSFDTWIEQFKVGVWDEWEEDWVYVYFGSYVNGEPIAKVWDETFNLNAQAMASVVQMVDANFQRYIQSLNAGGGASGGITEEQSEDVEEIEKATEETEKNIEQQIEEINKKTPEVQQQLREAEIELAKYNEERAQNASRMITDALQSLDTALATINLAIANDDFDTISTANANLDAMIQSMNDAIAEISGLQGDGYSDTISELNTAIQVINAVKLQVATAADKTKTLAQRRSAANIAKNALNGLDRLSDARKAINHAEIMRRKAKGLTMKNSEMLSAFLALVESYELLRGDITKMRQNFRTIVKRYMTDMNTLGAYLGSTNAMEYLSMERDVEDLTGDDFMRWFKFSQPDKIDDNYGFGSSRIGGKQWSFAFDTFTSTYSMWAWPLVNDWRAGHEGEKVSGFLKFMDHYNLTGMSTQYNGFYEQDDNTSTNWYAKNITAPKNWADGTSIIVTNGVFRALSGAQITFSSAPDSDVRFNITTNEAGTINVEIGVYWK